MQKETKKCGVDFSTTLMLEFNIFFKDMEKWKVILDENKYKHSFEKLPLYYRIVIMANIKRADILRRLLLNAKLI